MHSSWPKQLHTAGRGLLAAWFLAGAGCSAVVTQSAAPTAAEPQSQPAPQPPPPAPPAVEKLPEPAPPPSPVAEPPLAPLVVVLASALPAHAELAALLEEELGAVGHRVETLRLDDDAHTRRLAQLRAQPRLYAVAVGYEAARAARDVLAVPTVFCQVFNHQDLNGRGSALWGIASVPPLALQLQAWRRLDPSLARVGLIVSEEHRALAVEAEQAARDLGIALRYAISSSDRETLYLFRRMAREVDGLWLFPDNRILSPAAIAELLFYAARQGIQVNAVNAPLPPGGALLSATGSPADIATTARRLLERIVRGDTRGLPPLTPLSAVWVEVDSAAAARLRLEIPSETAWLVPAQGPGR